MKLFILILGIVTTIIIGISCDEKTVNPSENHSAFEDFIHFDTVNIVWSFRNIGGCGACEWVLNREQSLGEPFIDVNGNGVYEENIDIFIMSPGPDNQDIDRNSRYTGPDDPWSPGIPFDDLNGNGEYDRFSNFHYEDGFPFCDLNFNGVRDVDVGGVFAPIKFMPECNNSGYCTFKIKYVWGTVFRYISDSGITYTRDFQDTSTDFYHYFTMTPDALEFRDPQFRFTIHEKSDIYEIENKEVILSDSGLGDIIYLKTVEYGDSILFLGDVFRELLSIEFIKKPDQPAETDNYKFYFDKDLGLIGYTSSFGNCLEHYFTRRLDSLPLPMTRIPPNSDNLAAK
jgi:hypothetical protein